MASCFTLSQGISKECNSSMGGIKAVWLTDYKHGLFTQASGSDKAVTFETSYLNSFYRFHTNKSASSLTSTFNIDESTGNNYITTEVALQFGRMNADKRIAINALRQAEVQGVLLDNNGKAWVVGYDNPVIVTAGTAQTGAGISEANNYSITLTDTSADLPYELSESMVDELMKID